MSIKTLITTEYWIKKMTKWQEVNLGDVCKININNYSEIDGYRYVNYLDTGNITQNKIETIQKIDLSIDKLPVRAKRKAVLNDIVYSTVRPNQLHYGIIREKIENFLVSTGFTVISVDTEIAIPIYVYYYIIQPRITESMQAIAEQSVSAYPSIKPSDLAKIKIFLPPLNIQKKIAGVLGALDDKIELNNKINQNLEAQAQVLFKSWFIDFEPFGGKMPNDWKIGKLLDIATYLNGLAMQKFRPKKGETSIPVLKIKELRQGFCDTNSDLCSSAVRSDYIVQDGDVIFSWSGTLLVDLWCGGICGLNQHLFKVSSAHFDKWFYYMWTKHYLIKFSSIAADKATTMGHIKREDLEKANVLIPSKKAYIKINNLQEPILEKIIANRIENRKLTELRDTLLPKLMNGEIDVDNVKID